LAVWFDAQLYYTVASPAIAVLGDIDVILKWWLVGWIPL
jgi:hypothetical protein